MTREEKRTMLFHAHLKSVGAEHVEGRTIPKTRHDLWLYYEQIIDGEFLPLWTERHLNAEEIARILYEEA